MTSEQSKPIALDERDVHLFFCMFGRYEPAVALGIIVMLSVWALFIILHRTVRGQRRKRDENTVDTELRTVEKMTINNDKEQRRCHAASTENLSEEVSKAEDDSSEERGEVVSLARAPGLCDGGLDELSWSVSGDKPNVVPEAHDQARACWDIPQQHKGNRPSDICAHSALADHNGDVSVLQQTGHWKDLTKNEEEFHDHHTHHLLMRNHKDHASENQKIIKELASEEESYHHQHPCDNMESVVNHSDHDLETEKKVEFLYANLKSQPDLNSERLSVMEKAIKDHQDYFDDNQQGVSTQHNDLLNSVGDSSTFQKNMRDLVSDKDCQLEETCRITAVNVMETTVKSHQEILTDCQHLREHCEHLTNLHYHGLLSSLHERESARHQPLIDPSKADAIGEIVESKMKSPDGSRTQAPEDSYEKTEINIMEATMEYNEWMNGGTMESNKLIPSSGKILNDTASLGGVGMTEQSFQMSPDSIQAEISITEESATNSALFDGDPASKRAAAVQLMPRSVAVSFRVHYITHSPLQLLAVTGNWQELGNWEEFVPLRRAEDGFWVNSITLPAGGHAEWKFVVVENGRIHRWEECNNRHLLTGYEEVLHLHKWWGCV